MGKVAEGKLFEGFQRKIKRLTKDGSWTQLRLAKALGLRSVGGLQKWLDDESPSVPSLAILEKLAEVQGVSVVQVVAWLMEESTAATEGRTLAEYGKGLTEEQFLELHAEVDVVELTRRIELLTRVIQRKFPENSDK